MTTAEPGLDDAARAQFLRAAQELAAGKPREAEAAARALLQQHPEQPDLLHLLAGARARQGDHGGALNAVRRALAKRPDEAGFQCTLGVELAALGHLDDAMSALHEACRLQPNLAMAWFNLGVLQVRAVQFDAAEASLRKVLELLPDNLPARLQLADLLVSAGRVEDAVTVHREVLAARSCSGAAWLGLARLPAAGLGEADIPAMQAALTDPRASERERIALGFAMAHVLDRLGRHAQAMGVLAEAHAHASRVQPWDARGFDRGLDAILAAFAAPVASATDATLGRGVIFIASLPRSGSTLVEQILASHSQVEGSGELHDLPQVLAEESRQRGRHYPEWVGAMTSADWQRLGERYMERTARWRRNKPFCTDKLPGNWLHIGAIRAMLPGASIIVCQRDPLETCFACYRQFMSADGQGWTHRFADLGAYWNACDRALRQWCRQYPGKLFVQDYETLVSDPEANIHALLTACGLPYEAACLEFDRNPRDVRSPSATQVREPLRRDTARAPIYRGLLDPLRRALGYIDIMSAH